MLSASSPATRSATGSWRCARFGSTHRRNVITHPYKFAIVIPAIEGRYRWHRFWERRKLWAGVEVEDPHIKLGILLKDQERTYRVDIGQGYFCPDSLHWVRSSIRDLIRDTFENAKISKIQEGSTILMIWSNSLYWLDDIQARLVMESWNGQANEPRSLWRTAASTAKWAD